MIEHKLIELGRTEIKAGPSGEFEGYASTFGNVDAYGDTVAPGAFDETLKGRERPVRMRWNHFGPVIGRWLDLAPDSKGLHVRGSLTPAHKVAEDVKASLLHQAIDGLSIGYRPKRSEVDDVSGTRTLFEIELVEISVVEEPADLGATVGEIKSAIEQAQSFKQIEQILRDGGSFSCSQATAIVARIKSIALGDRAADRDSSSSSAAAAKVVPFERVLESLKGINIGGASRAR